VKPSPVVLLSPLLEAVTVHILDITKSSLQENISMLLLLGTIPVKLSRPLKDNFHFNPAE